jgi:TorA maturation chaperone TorD
MELLRALAALSETPQAQHTLLAEALELGEPPDASAYTELFVFQLYPYASVYLGAEGMLGGEARDRVAGFWRALGEVPPAEPDHLALMLGLYARLVELEEHEKEAQRIESWRSARKAFLWEHLLSWLPAYLTKLDEIAAPFYRRWGGVLMAALAEESATVGRQELLPLALREPLKLFDPREDGVGEFLQTVLTPARSGMILVRADLARAARELNLGLRLGERKYVLESLFGQDARGMLGWLAREASSWAERHRAGDAAFGGVARIWEAKAETSARILKELETTTGEAL